VDWYPWGEEAFRRAREEGKPVFLSIGYSACHWCHVMERESFENEDLAAVLNDHFVAVKVDREERPDVDEIYMTATQLATGSGGWPNSLWLTPDGRPWFAGTYFPPDDAPGRPGFRTILMSLAEMWRTRGEEVEQQADRLAAALQQLSTSPASGAAADLSRDLVDRAIAELGQAYDDRRGGFGGAPKFPPVGALNLLFQEYGRTGEASVLRMAIETLDGMASGGIRDHLGGGFHRYSTDERWFLPHFEKMLYDNAQISRTCVDAYRVTGREAYREIAAEIYGWVLGEMTDPQGGFYSALDADSEGVEGKFYVWRRDEILRVLGDEEGDLFCRVYGVEEDGNFRDEATGRMPGTNVLYLPRPVEVSAQAESIPIEDLKARMKNARERLLEVRSKRARPNLDDKVLTSWNGLMIGSLAYAGRHLEEAAYTTAAERAAKFMLSEMRRDGRLLRSYRDGEARLNAYLDDYAFLAGGLLDLYETMGKNVYLDEARSLVDALIEHHRDKAGGGFFFTSDDHEDLLTRSKDPLDKAIPSGNGMAAQVLLRLGRLTRDARYDDLVGGSLEAFSHMMHRTPRGTESLILALAEHLEQARGRTPEPEGRGAPLARLREKPVTVEAFFSSTGVAPGETVEVELRIRIDDGWHIHSNRPLQEHLVPTTLELKDGGSAALAKVGYPEGKRVQLGFSDEPLLVYENEVTIAARIEISPNAPGGKIELLLGLKVQACSDQACLAPMEYVVAIPVEIRG